MRKVLLSLLLVLSFTLVAQSDFEYLNTQHGLSQNDINFIHQDSKGFMWFGTVDGLNRYDGLSMKVYQYTTPMTHSIGSNLPYCMVEDKLGNFWIGTSDDGIWYFDHDQEEFHQFPYEINGRNVFTDKQVIALYLDSNEKLWVATARGLTIVDLEAYKKREYKALNHKTYHTKQTKGIPESINNIYFIEEDSYGQIWIGSAKGLFQAEISTDLELSLKRVTVLPPSTCMNFLELEGGYLVTVYNGTCYLTLDDIKKGTKPKYLANKFFNTQLLTTMGYYFGGNSSGLFQYKWDPINKNLKEINHFKSEFNNIKSLSKNNVVTLFEDNSGLLWVGTNGGGLNKLDLNEKKFNHYYRTTHESSLAYNKVRDIIEDEVGNIWFGTEGGGISLLSKKHKGDYTKSFINKDIYNAAISQNYVYSFSAIPELKNAVIVGTGYPHKVLIATATERGTIEMQPFPDLIKNPVFSSLTDSKGNIWLGTYGDGLYKTRYNTKTKSLEVVSHFAYQDGQSSEIASNKIRAIAEDKEGNILVGTDNGLSILHVTQIDKQNPKFIKIKHNTKVNTSLGHNYVLSLFVDSKGRRWVGTMGGGLSLIVSDSNDNYVFKRYSTLNGLPNDVIKAIEEDNNGNLWISSNKGLTQFNPNNEEIRNYSVVDGLQDFEFSESASCKRRNGELLFGGVNGFNSFYPSDIKDNPYASTIQFTELHVLNQHVGPGDEINDRIILEKALASEEQLNLLHDENSFSIGFSGMHFVAPEKIKYKYKLDGFEENWNQASSINPKAIYTNVPSGSYTLKVLATNNDGVWNTVPSSIQIEITPPFWRTIWAMLLYLLILLAMLLFFRRYSVIAVTQKNKLMMEHFKQEQMEELVQLKLQFFTNISHEFRTPLTLIQAPLEQLITKVETSTVEFRKKNYTVMMKNIQLMNRLITQLMEFRKLEKGKMPLEVGRGNICDLVNDVSSAFEDVASSKGVNFEIRSTYKVMELWFDYDKIEKVLFNLLSNSFKFTRTGGRISILVSEVETEGQEWVKIDVTDNGPGIEKNKIPYLFERFYQTGNHKLSKVSGTGIGLAFAKSLVDLHSGRITVESEVDVKTVFSVYLKKGKLHFSKDDFLLETNFNTSDTEPIINEINTIESNQNIKIDTNKQTILLVEDNPDVQGLLMDAFKDKYNCIQSFNGLEGIEAAKKYLPNLIVSDVMMPEMDGFEMVTAIKKDALLCHIPIVMLTAKTTDSDKLTGLGEGAEAYVSKPFSIEVLDAQINSILNARKLVINKYSKSFEIQPEEVTFTSIDEKLIERLLKVVEKNISNPEFTVVQLADEVGMSQSILNKKLKALLGQTANVFIRSIRLKRAAQLLKLGRLSVTDIVYEVGFNDVKYFRECFRKQFAKTPTEYAKSQQSEEEDSDEEN